jgi:hypothetical protein
LPHEGASNAEGPHRLPRAAHAVQGYPPNSESGMVQMIMNWESPQTRLARRPNCRQSRFGINLNELLKGIALSRATKFFHLSLAISPFSSESLFLYLSNSVEMSFCFDFECKTGFGGEGKGFTRLPKSKHKHNF